MNKKILINSFIFYLLTLSHHSYSNDLNNHNISELSSNVFNKLENENNNSKTNAVNSNMPNISNEQIFKALNTLINDKTVTSNPYIPEVSKTKMEFELYYKPRLSANRSASGIDNFSYEIVYMDKSKTDLKNYISLHNNTSLIKRSTSESLYIKIYFKYSSDKNDQIRRQLINQFNERGVTLFEKDLSEINERYKPTLSFEQGINFTIEKIDFDNILDLPTTINIWVKNSKQLYPCHLKKNQSTSTRTGNGKNYVIQYSCELLPNLADYGKELKILFD